MSVTLGHFELQDQIGQGGMGTVFRAYDPTLVRNVAIKLLDEDLAKDPQFVENFIREARNAAAISHPHIVPIYYVGEEDGRYFIVMELLWGQPLSAMVQEGPLPEAMVMRLAREIAEALKAAYSRKMIHGDIKPQNIFVTKDHGAKLLDFGLAKLANVEVAAADGVWGSAYYVSPERIGQQAEDFRSDIYSLGATIFDALTGHPPFEAPTAEELTAKRLEEKPPLLRTLNPNISKRTERIVNKMLAKSPLLRHLDYDSLINDLRKAEDSPQGDAPSKDTTEMLRVATAQIPAVAPKSSQLPLMIMAGAAVVLAAGAVAFVVLREKSQPAPGPVPVALNTPTPAPTAQPTPQATPSPSPQPLAQETPIPTAQPRVNPGPAPLVFPEAASATPLPSPNGTKIRQFTYKSGNAKSVQIVGNFDLWQPEPMLLDDQGTWSITKELPRNVVLEYQFVVDGVKTPDPHEMNGVSSDGAGSLKSTFVIPQDPLPRPSRPHKSPTDQSAPKPTPAVIEPSGDVDMAVLAANPTLWPKTAALKNAVLFSIMINGQAAGQIQASPGMQVNLVKVTPDQLTVSFQGSEKNIPVGSTDLIDRVKAIQREAIRVPEPVDPATAANLALKHPATCSGNENGHPAEDAVDGDPDTRWTAPSADPGAWLQVDLGAPTRIKSCEIEWEQESKYYEYTLAGSPDGQKWTKLADQTTAVPASPDSASRLSRINLPVVQQTRYIRVTVTGGLSRNRWASIMELRVFGE